MKYVITLKNGNWPLTCECDTLCGAYNALEDISLNFKINIDMEEVMEILVNMKRGKTLAHENARWGVKAGD